MEARRMKEERGRWFEGRGRERDGSDGRRVVMGGWMGADLSELYGFTEAPGV